MSANPVSDTTSAIPDVTCADCRMPIKSSQSRLTLGDHTYHADTCGPVASATKWPDYVVKLEEARECVRNLWRSKALREREHYHLIGIIEAAEKAAADALAQARREREEMEAERDAALEIIGRAIINLPPGMRTVDPSDGIKSLRAVLSAPSSPSPREEERERCAPDVVARKCARPIRGALTDEQYIALLNAITEVIVTERDVAAAIRTETGT